MRVKAKDFKAYEAYREKAFDQAMERKFQNIISKQAAV